MLEFNIIDESCMLELGEKMGALLYKGAVIYLRGELGAGKTTITRGILKGLGYTGPVTSPTFTLINVYETFCPVYHCDFYRLRDIEIYELGLDDYVGSDGIAIIEWPDKGVDFLPAEGLYVDLTLIDDDYELGRHINVSAVGGDYGSLLERLKEHVDISS
ncbi:MAG: tRNA (adenosine(37)-N6)-threonylcarbamoyltransferase complex ATPase subunit type 1 TsaE [Syntrophomonadaceae bacterium]|jgi:tRNA threonylcarbamoyladenosine biosynthesis protein TsaE|nr:tRNA (adenosine(37)-N6)-threonylcarbamoyltransferase complex ATPase subunit type 1 TsaE [Syntrophomonadaceae bacterium]